MQEIKKILKQLTRERAKKEIDAIQRVKLPPYFQKWIKEYKKVSNRSSYLWLWTYRSVQLVTLPDVPLKYRRSLYETKSLMVMFVTLLDDVADNMKSEKLLQEILKTPFFKKKDIKFHQLNFKERRYLKFTMKLWDHIIKTIERYPKYYEFKDIFEFDLNQILNIIKYAYLVNKKNCLINKTEYCLYFPHNLPIILSFTIDLMCYLKFDIKELGKIREVGWEAQKLGQSVNWITTWEREITDKDFTSGIFAYAIDLDVLKVDELKEGKNGEIIKKIKKAEIEKKVLKECSPFYNKIKKLKKKIKTIDVGEFLLNFKKLIILQLSSRGNY